MPTRKYEQRLRAEAAGETRRRILDAVSERLRAAPSEPVSVDRVAQVAGVARSTVYLTFSSRAGLFCALGTDLLQRGGFEQVLQAATHQDALTGLREVIRSTVGMYAANRDVLRALYSMAQLDADAVGGAIQRMEAGRADGMAHLARRLAAQGVMRPEITAGEAADLLWVLTSFDSFDLLFTGRGMPARTVAGTLITTAGRSLCRAPPPRSHAG
jgi:AcrR family transcriptional regulator